MLNMLVHYLVFVGRISDMRAYPKSHHHTPNKNAMLKKPRTKGVNNMQEFKERRKGWQESASRNFMEIITICGLVAVIYMPEIVGFLEGWS